MPQIAAAQKPLTASVRLVSLALSATLAAPPLYAAERAERVDLATFSRIRDEGLSRSKVMDHLKALCDDNGPRLTGSPGYRRAAEWTSRKLTEMGLANVREESIPSFGRGWTLEQVSVHLVAPNAAPIPAWPKAWTPGTDGPKRGPVVRAKLEKDEDLETWKGKLEGKILLVGEPLAKDGVYDLSKGADEKRYTKDELDNVEAFESGDRRGRAPGGPGGPGGPREARKRFEFQRKLLGWLAEQKVLATIETSSRPDGTLRVMGGGDRRPDRPVGPPALMLAAEAFGRISRLVEKNVPVELEVDVKATFHPEDPKAAANVLGDLPGGDKALKSQVVMLGAHLDSWHAGTGVTDNGAGSAVVIEAMRILKALGLTPRRTIRVALWAGEEQGLLGSRAYVEKYLASRPEPKDPAEKELPGYLRRPAGPLTFKPGYKDHVVYFNLDNGSGKIRGIYAQESLEARFLFEDWIEPFADLGATHVTMRRTGSTDHMAFDGVGVPGFQFIQDPLDYFARTHHTGTDIWERARPKDLAQAATIMAAFVWQAAQRDDPFPRKALPPDAPPAPEGEEGGER